MTTALSTGALWRIIIQNEQDLEPLLQVLESNQNKDRQLLILSDGNNQFAGTLLTEEKIEQFSIIKLKKYLVVKKEASEEKIVLILEKEVLARGSTIGNQIGDPKMLSDQNRPSGSGQITAAQAEDVTGINTLNNTLKNWKIIARVTNKTELISFANGRFFSFHFVDESGEIRCTAFNAMADKFFSLVEEGKTYSVSKCQIKNASEHNTVQNQKYEMFIREQSEIEEYLDDRDTNYGFIPLDQIGSLTPNSTVDVIGVCKDTSDIIDRNSRKRKITLVDQSNTSIQLTLQGDQAETFDGSDNPVIAVKRARVEGDRNLTAALDSEVKVNPHTDECYNLKGWYELSGKNKDDQKNKTPQINITIGIGNF